MRDVVAEIDADLDASARSAKRKLRCSFCRKTLREVRRLVTADTGSAICDQCIGQAVELIAR